jgi:hypothetical protein
MKAKLIKVLDQYHLYDGDKAIATTIVGNPMLLPNLSKQNCDEIFGVVDVEKLAENKYGKGIYEIEQVDAYIEGFNKAMELNKDKVFTLEDVLDAWELGASEGLPLTKAKKEKLLKSIQPIEIEVEIVMGDSIGISDLYTPDNKPKLDSEGCLILKKI